MARKRNLLASIAAIKRALKTKTYRSVLIRTVLIGPAGETIRGWERVNAPPGQRFSSQGVDHILTQAVQKCEEMYPGRTFELVALTDGSFSFVEQPRNPSWQPPTEVDHVPTLVTRATFQSQAETA